MTTSSMPPADPPSGPGGLTGLGIQAADAASALAALKQPAEAAAQGIEQAFSRAGAGLAKSLARGASDGKLSLQDLARAVLAAVDVAAGLRVGGPVGLGLTLAGAVGKAVGGLFAGARAGGGPVAPGGAVLVGETGPEVFRPQSAGTVEPIGQAVTINLTVQGPDGQALLRSESQIAQALARAAALGARRL